MKTHLPLFRFLRFTLLFLATMPLHSHAEQRDGWFATITNTINPFSQAERPAPTSLSESQELKDVLFSLKKNYLEKYLQEQRHTLQRSLYNAPLWKDSDPEAYNQCVHRYQKIFANDEMNINITFGYSDSNGETLDGRLYKLTYEALKRRCEDRYDYACDFKHNEGLMLSLGSIIEVEKEIYVPLPGLNSPKKVKITLAHSANDSYDLDNFNGEYVTKKQYQTTKIAEQNFFAAISGFDTKGNPYKKCDACIYTGHARSGGGPDFGPVPLQWRLENGEPDYRQYQARKTNYARLLDALEKAKKHPPTLVAVLACYSHLQFYQRKVCVQADSSKCIDKSLADYSESTGFLLTKKYSWFSNWGKNIGAVVDNLVGLKCGSSLDENFKNFNTSPIHREPYRVYGNF